MEHLGIVNYTTYVIGVIMIILLPGPNSVYVLALAAQQGVHKGWLAAAGIFVGDALLMLATAAGAATLLHANPKLFMLIKYAGAMYLAYLGLRMLITAWHNWSHSHDSTTSDTLHDSLQHSLNKPSSPFTKALVISLLNPKAILFFLSFFVQFVDPAYPQPIHPFLVLAITLQCFSLIYLATLIYAGVYLAATFRAHKKLSAVSNGIVGTAFMLFAMKLATASL